MTFPFGMIKFRNDFRWFSLCYAPLFAPFFMIKKMTFFFVMIRGKSPLLPKWGSRTVIVECSPCHSERKVLLSYRKRDSGIIWKWTDKSVINLNGFLKWRSLYHFKMTNMIIISEWLGGERLRMTVIFIIFGMRFIFFSSLELRS